MMTIDKILKILDEIDDLQEEVEIIREEYKKNPDDIQRSMESAVGALMPILEEAEEDQDLMRVVCVLAMSHVLDVIGEDILHIQRVADELARDLDPKYDEWWKNIMEIPPEYWVLRSLASNAVLAQRSNVTMETLAAFAISAAIFNSKMIKPKAADLGMALLIVSLRGCKAQIFRALPLLASELSGISERTVDTRLLGLLTVANGCGIAACLSRDLDVVTECEALAMDSWRIAQDELQKAGHAHLAVACGSMMREE